MLLLLATSQAGLAGNEGCANPAKDPLVGLLALMLLTLLPPPPLAASVGLALLPVPLTPLKLAEREDAFEEIELTLTASSLVPPPAWLLLCAPRRELARLLFLEPA